MSLHTLLRAHRAVLGLSIEGLAERSGVSDRTISDIERGVSANPRSATIFALAEALALDDESRNELLTAARVGRFPMSPTSPRETLEPQRLSDFSGRENEVARISRTVAGGPDPEAPYVVVLSGLPGVGKTTLAIETAHRLASENAPRLFVDLGGQNSPTSLLHALEVLLRQLVGDVDKPRTTEEALAGWAAATTNRPPLVVLDDASSEDQIRPLIDVDRRARFLVTSRRTLAGLKEADHLRVPVLPREFSVELLDATVPERQKGSGHLDELASLCGDLPLALRIASLRISSRPSWTVAELARRLRSEDRRLSVLVAGDIGVRASFSTSYDALSRRARDVFRQLSLLTELSFDPATVGFVLAIPVTDAAEVLSELVDLGLIESLQDGRFRMHALLRLYSGERLRADVSEELVAGALRRLELLNAGTVESIPLI